MKCIGLSSNTTQLQIDSIKEIVKLSTYLQFLLPKLYNFEIIQFVIVYFISCWAKFQSLKTSMPSCFGIFYQDPQICRQNAFVTILDKKRRKKKELKIFEKFKVNTSWMLYISRLSETPPRVDLFASGWSRPLRPLSDPSTVPQISPKVQTRKYPKSSQ